MVWYKSSSRSVSPLSLGLFDNDDLFCIVGYFLTTDSSVSATDQQTISIIFGDIHDQILNVVSNRCTNALYPTVHAWWKLTYRTSHNLWRDCIHGHGAKWHHYVILFSELRGSYYRLIMWMAEEGRSHPETPKTKEPSGLFFPPWQWSISENISSCKKWNGNILNLTIKGYFLRLNMRRKFPLIVWLSLFLSRRDFSTKDPWTAPDYSSSYDALNVRSFM